MNSFNSVQFSDDQKTLLAGILCCLVLSSFVVYAFMMPVPEQPIFPMWVVKSNGQVPYSTMNITLGASYELLVGVQNKMGKFEDCSIQVKLRNSSSPIPISGNATLESKESSLTPIMSFNFELSQGESWQTEFNFSFQQSSSISSIVINNQLYSLPEAIPVEAMQTPSYQFLFELWTKLGSGNGYVFSGIWVSSPFLIANQTIAQNNPTTSTPTSTTTSSNPTQTSNPTPAPTTQPTATPTPEPTVTLTPSSTPMPSPTSLSLSVTFVSYGGGSGSSVDPFGTASYTYGQVVSISAIADVGFLFNHWAWDPADSIVIADRFSNFTSVTIYGSGTVTAVFTSATLP